MAVLEALAAPRHPDLRARLGAAGDDALRAALHERARAWARAAGDGAAPLELADADALPAALGDHPGPVVLVAPDVPALSGAHLAALRGDLAAGVLLSAGASGDGTPYLVVLATSDPALLALADAPLDAMLAAAAADGRELGMLRAERRLASVADARALQVDPVAPPELRALLATLG